MSINFLQKYETLRKSVPIPAVRITQLEDCKMVDYTHFSKHCYHTFTVMASEHATYSTLSVGKHLLDCDLAIFSEFCYECCQVTNCYNSTYLADCINCQDCHFCANCNNCQNCFGCVSLSNKQYCFFNKQLDKDAYEKELVQAQKLSASQNQAKMQAIFTATPQPQSRQHNNVNCPYGDYLNNSQNIYWGFNTFYSENSGYLFDCGTVRNGWDMTFSGGGGSETGDLTAITDEFVYEMVGGASNYNCSFGTYLNHCNSCFYCFGCKNCSDCFGCVGLSNKKYCILNNQLNKEQYEKAVLEIKKELGWPLKH
ncbi:hypothetical protein GYA49_01385 [Candidatus Beckwithbacteria bacterium]|nr:hypothetical protein [Candidatus Beckwithbacteria bacterium]